MDLAPTDSIGIWDKKIKQKIKNFRERAERECVARELAKRA
jgi:hypothetical protein